MESTMQPVMTPPRPEVYAEPTRTVQYASFWQRFLALIIDAVVLMVMNSIIMGVMAGGGALSMRPDIRNGNLPPAFFSVLAGSYLAILVLNWLYFALMESSKNQGTLGKMALGLRVTDLEGNRISFGRATGRYFAKLISGFILCIGYLMAAFTEKKQGLHDMIASTLVLTKASVVPAQVAQNAYINDTQTA